MFRKIIIGFLVFVLPSFLGVILLRVLGVRIGKKVKIGFSFIATRDLEIGDNVIIGHFNLILNKKIILKNQSKIGYLNILKGPFTLILQKKAAIGNKNYFTRGPAGVTYGESILELGELTKITTEHHVDLTRSIKFGDFSILAGINSQMWTHGYYHANTGKHRVRIDGSIVIGNNVYIGSGCIFNPGVKVSDAINLGARSIITKDLDKPGMYVSQGLRFIDNDLEVIKTKLKKVQGFDLVEQVYTK
jgi:acetyltransferase-like isoleucine patch superfamily enzyme